MGMACEGLFMKQTKQEIAWKKHFLPASGLRRLGEQFLSPTRLLLSRRHFFNPVYLS